MILRLFEVTKFNQTLNNGKIEHIGIAVKDLAVSNLIFEKLFERPINLKRWKVKGSTSFLEVLIK
jgi:hypothetical protein